MLSNDPKESATYGNNSENNPFESSTDQRCEELLMEMGIEDEYKWIHIDDCPAYECLTDTSIVKMH